MPGRTCSTTAHCLYPVLSAIFCWKRIHLIENRMRARGSPNARSDLFDNGALFISCSLRHFLLEKNTFNREQDESHFLC